jgi:hypothetical protein
MGVLYTGSASGLVYGTGLADSTIVFAIENMRESNRLVTIKRAALFLDPGFIAYTAVRPIFKCYRVTNFDRHNGGGDLLAKGAFDTTETSSPYVNIFTGNSNSWGSPSRFTATTGNISWQTFTNKMATGAWQYKGNPMDIITKYTASADPDHVYILYPGETYLVVLTTSTTLQDPPNDVYMFNTVWTEEDLATYTISGTVTLSGSGVTNAHVTVIIADDTNLTNAFLWANILTTAGTGAWTCNIPIGKIAYVYAQDYTGGIYYTSAGNPFVS